MSDYSERAQRNQRIGYVDALADINAIIATTFGTDAERIARIEEWVKNNTSSDEQPVLQARVAEFLS